MRELKMSKGRRQIKDRGKGEPHRGRYNQTQVDVRVSGKRKDHSTLRVERKSWFEYTGEETLRKNRFTLLTFKSQTSFCWT